LVKLPKIKKFHISNDSLKELGEVIANEKGRRIIMSLVEKQMYANEIAHKLEIPISLVLHHLQKLEKLDLLEITEKPISKKTKNHRFFRITSDIFMEFTKESDNKLKEIFKEGLKFTSIGFLGLLSFFTANYLQIPSGDQFGGTSTKSPGDPYISSTIALSLIIIGIITAKIISWSKKRKKG
jgi:DNA-binding transcriptional ArsR family regulator